MNNKPRLVIKSVFDLKNYEQLIRDDKNISSEMYSQTIIRLLTELLELFEKKLDKVIDQVKELELKYQFIRENIDTKESKKYDHGDDYAY